VKRRRGAYLSLSHGLFVPTAIALLSRGTHVNIATASSIIFMRATYDIVLRRVEMALLVLLLIYYALPVVYTSRYILLAKHSI
jgi:hypothetical protein